MSTDNPDHKQSGESLSFQDITAEFGDIQIPTGKKETREPIAETSAPPDFPGGTILVDDTNPVPPKEEPMNTVALTGSSPKPRPMWLDGLVCDVLAALFILPVLLNIGLRGYQPWVSYSALFLALGGAVWSLFGLQVEAESTGRKMCFISAGIGLLVAIVAFVIRAPLH